MYIDDFLILNRFFFPPEILLKGIIHKFQLSNDLDDNYAIEKKLLQDRTRFLFFIYFIIIIILIFNIIYC